MPSAAFQHVLIFIAAVLAFVSLSIEAQDGLNYYNISVGNLVPNNYTSDAIATSLTTSNSTVPKGTKTPSHVLTGGGCISADICYASTGSHYATGTEDGEQIKVVAIMSHPNISESTKYAYDFVVLQLQKPTSFKPIRLGDSSDIKDGETITKVGWYNTAGEGQDAPELQRADEQLMSNEECSKLTSVDDTRMCSRPIGSEPACLGDYVGPVIVKRPEGDVVVGLVSHGDDCDKPGYPGYYSRISAGHDWIEMIISGNCYH